MKYKYRCIECSKIITDCDELKKVKSDVIRINDKGHKTIGPIYKHKNCGGLCKKIDVNVKLGPT